MSTLLFRDKRIFALVIMVMLAAGMSALFTIGRQEDPTITNLFATIVTPYPGADPARVEALVTERIEDELKEISEIDVITSVSRNGVSVIQIELSQFISKIQIEQTWSEIRDALSDAERQFPPGVPTPEFDNDRVGAYTAISAILPREGTTTNPAIMRRTAEILQDRLRNVAGTKLVVVFGARDEEITVEINRENLLSLGLTAESVSRAIAQSDAKVRAGQVRGQSNDLLIEVAGELKSLERIRNIPVHEGQDGRIVRVRDIATVKRALREPAQNLAIVDGTPAVIVAARMEDELQVDAWSNKVNNVYREFSGELPAGLELRTLFDQATYTAGRLKEVLGNMGLGITIVVSVLFLTLGWRAALVVAIVIPLAATVSVAGLKAVGIPIHQMSVTGLIVSLGLLVDAAIVMTDDIRKRLAAGASKLEAVDAAVRRLVLPLLASTITTVLAFMPMVLLPGPAGDFVGAIAIAVIIMLVVSFVLAVSVTPAMSGWLLKAQSDGEKTSWLSTGLQFRFIGRVFQPLMTMALRAPRLAILGALILPIIGFGAFPTLKPQFFPGVDRNQFHIQLQLANGAAISATQRAVQKAETVIREEGGVTNLTWVVGENAPAFYYNMIANQDNEPAFAEALVTTKSPDATEDMLDRLQRRLDIAIPEARIIVRGLVQGPPVNAPVEIRIVGQSLETLRALGDQVRLLMLDVPGITQALTELSSGAPKVVVDLEEEKVRLAGLDYGRVAQQLEAQLEGQTGGSIVESSEELPVRVRVGANERGAIDAVSSLDLTGPNAIVQAARGEYPGIPVTALGSVELKPAKTPIYRRDGERVNTVQGFVERNILPEEALRLVQQRIAESGLKLPKGYRFEVGGDSDARDETLRNLLGSMGLIVTLTIATIVLTFGSYRLSLVTAAVAVLSIGLSLLALAVFRYPFGIQAVIGVIGSIGVSINAAIIILTALQQDTRALSGDLTRIREVVMGQGRHIVSTTVTTFGGFLPLILEGGGFWPPFAMSIAGGVLLSTVVSFFFVPPMFVLLARSSRVPSGASSVAASDAGQPAALATS